MTYRLSIASFALAALLFGSVVPAFASHTNDDDNDEARCWIDARPSTIYEDGSTTLTWDSHNADDAWIEDIGDVSLSGSRVIYGIDDDTTFTMTVENERGTATCETEVSVRAYHTSTSNKAPGCTIWRENTAWGSGVILRWQSTEATSAHLSGVGAVSTYGAYTVYPTYDTTYTLTVYGNGQPRQCELEIDRDYSYGSYGSYGTHYPQNTPTYTPGYSYNYPYVALTQIPYTGLDFGIAGTMLYVAVFALFAIAGAYLLAYYQGGVLRFSFAREVQVAMRNQARTISSFFVN